MNDPIHILTVSGTRRIGDFLLSVGCFTPSCLLPSSLQLLLQSRLKNEKFIPSPLSEERSADIYTFIHLVLGINLSLSLEDGRRVFVLVTEKEDEVSG